MIARHGSYLGQIYLANCKHVISYESTKDPSAASLLSQDIGHTPWQYSSVFTLHHLGCVILGTLAQSSSLSNSVKSKNIYALNTILTFFNLNFKTYQWLPRLLAFD